MINVLIKENPKLIRFDAIPTGAVFVVDLSGHGDFARGIKVKRTFLDRDTDIKSYSTYMEEGVDPVGLAFNAIMFNNRGYVQLHDLYDEDMVEIINCEMLFSK